VGGVGLDLVAGDCAGADGRQGWVTLGEVQLFAVRFGIAGGDFQGVMGRDAGADAGHGRVALNKVRAMGRGLGKRRGHQGQGGGNQSKDSLAVSHGEVPPFRTALFPIEEFQREQVFSLIFWFCLAKLQNLC